MKALVLNDINDIKVKESEKPEIKPNEVLVKVKACGICGSDIPRAYKTGAHKSPIIIGHEFAGEIVECGDEVASWMFDASDYIGKRVGVFPLIPCCNCKPCSEGKFELCRNYNYLGSRSDGGFAEFVAVPGENIIELPDEVSFEDAAMLEPTAVAIHAIRQTGLFKESPAFEAETPVGAGPAANKPIAAVCGLGSIGLLLTMHLLNLADGEVYVMGNRDLQKEKALSLGIKEENYFDVRSGDAASWLKEKTGGDGVDAFFECVGKNETFNLGVECAAPSGHIVVVGNPYSDVDLPKDRYWKILRNQLTIHGSWNSSFTGNFNDDWHFCLDEMAKGNIKPSELISHRFPLDDIVKGLEIMRDKSEDYIKIMSIMD